MGPTEGSFVAVADAGPLIHLDELDCLDIRPTLLREIVEEVERS